MIGFFSVAGLMLSAIVVTSDLPLEHRTRVDHASGSMEAHYVGTVHLVPKQVGSPGPGGRTSTLRCEWSVMLTVNREARHEAGGLLSHTMTDREGLTLSRPGWCNSSREAAKAEVASRTDELQQRLVALVAEDRDTLLAQVERQNEQRNAA
jgi:hypothetical protein